MVFIYLSELMRRYFRADKFSYYCWIQTRLAPRTRVYSPYHTRSIPSPPQC